MLEQSVEVPCVSVIESCDVPANRDFSQAANTRILGPGQKSACWRRRNPCVRERQPTRGSLTHRRTVSVNNQPTRSAIAIAIDGIGIVPGRLLASRGFEPLRFLSEAIGHQAAVRP